MTNKNRVTFTKTKGKVTSECGEKENATFFTNISIRQGSESELLRNLATETDYSFKDALAL